MEAYEFNSVYSTRRDSRAVWCPTDAQGEMTGLRDRRIVRSETLTKSHSLSAGPTGGVRFMSTDRGVNPYRKIRRGVRVRPDNGLGVILMR